jgi:hypothetical protein
MTEREGKVPHLRQREGQSEAALGTRVLHEPDGPTVERDVGHRCDSRMREVVVVATEERFEAFEHATNPSFP